MTSARARPAEPSGASRTLVTAANVFAVLSICLALGIIVLQAVIGQLGSSASKVAGTASGITFILAFNAVGAVVIHRKPRNPMGWLLLALVTSVDAGTAGPAYAYYDYADRHGTLPLGHLAVLLSPAWEYAFILMPLVILLFPDGQPGRRWRWPVRAYCVLGVVVVIGTISVAVAAFSLRVPVDNSGNLIGLSNPHGANAWFAPVQTLGLGACFVLTLVALIHQVRCFHRASGERRQQLKWLAAGAGFCIACLVLNTATGGGSGVIGQLTFSVGLTVLPVAIGIGILKFRLYEIDRLISRTLSYTILTALLVGTFIGLVALTTNTLALSGTVGVAASTLAAAGLFNPLRRRIQHRVDRRFNRARYDADATVATFAARLRHAVDLDTVQSELLEVVRGAVAPEHATVWLRGSERP